VPEPAQASAGKGQFAIQRENCRQSRQVRKKAAYFSHFRIIKMQKGPVIRAFSSFV
jgi:hypothetical protein